MAPLPTTGLGDALLLVNINSSDPLIEAFPTREDSAVQLSAPGVSVPETSNLVVEAAAVLGLIGLEWLRRRRAALQEK